METQCLLIETRGLRKTFASLTKDKTQEVVAVQGVDLQVRTGEIFGFLGPNGAGKSTTQKMLATLLAPSDGQATIAGYDLATQKQEIRQCIGFVSQAGGADSTATGLENLILQAELYGIAHKEAVLRAQDLVERFQMSSFISRQVSTYSGGQRRRLDIALGMIHKPKLLLLDEPTVGLDPQSRAYLWEEIKQLRNEGTTILLTTHYLDEADKLCDTLAIIDHGSVVAYGSPAALKSEIGADIVTFSFIDAATAHAARELLKDVMHLQQATTQEAVLHLEIKDGEKMLAGLLRQLDSAQLDVHSIALHKPSLDDVFLRKTGRSLREENS